MFISKIKINNFRNFKNKEVIFNEGVNVIIGHNNAGKTNLIKALSLVLDYKGSKRLDVDDFNKFTSIAELKDNPPKVTITLTINKGTDEEPDDLVTVGNWLTKLDASYEALLTYEFFLPEKEKAGYLKDLSKISETDPSAMTKAWNIIKHNFIRFYISRIWGGNVINQTQADSESLQRFDFQFLNAIRDVERDMLTGRNSLLKDVLDFFMDYNIKSVPESAKPKEVKKEEIRNKEKEFSEISKSLLDVLQNRMKEGKEEILSYAKQTGASFNNAIPNFEGEISEAELFSALKLIVEYNTGIKIPATHNGLGYNNLIYMSLLLAKMQVDSDGDYMSGSAKIFATLAIEEPEAHLHPAMQYKFLKFLKDNRKKKKVRQIFVTTHSTHITSAVSLDEIICLHNENGETSIAYPGKVFINDQSKKYVQRFLDATKSDMLFAQKVILVEGLAEQLLFSIFANYINKSLEDNHIAVINVGGRFFKHFLCLFDSIQANTINKKIACVTDRDPERKAKTGRNYNSCYPFEYNQDTTTYDYKNNATDLLSSYNSHPNIRYFSQEENGKTFEYDLILHNPSMELLVTSSMSNQDEIKLLMRLFNENRSLTELENELQKGTENTQILNSLASNMTWNDAEKKKAIIAARYLNSITKGENALDLVVLLEDNLNKKGSSDYKLFNVPTYIKDAIEWICQ